MELHALVSLLHTLTILVKLTATINKLKLLLLITMLIALIYVYQGISNVVENARVIMIAVNYKIHP